MKLCTEPLIGGGSIHQHRSGFLMQSGRQFPNSLDRKECISNCLVLEVCDPFLWGYPVECGRLLLITRWCDARRCGVHLRSRFASTAQRLWFDLRTSQSASRGYGSRSPQSAPRSNGPGGDFGSACASPRPSTLSRNQRRAPSHRTARTVGNDESVGKRRSGR